MFILGPMVCLDTLYITYLYQSSAVHCCLGYSPDTSPYRHTFLHTQVSQMPLNCPFKVWQTLVSQRSQPLLFA